VLLNRKSERDGIPGGQTVVVLYRGLREVVEASVLQANEVADLCGIADGEPLPVEVAEKLSDLETSPLSLIARFGGRPDDAYSVHRAVCRIGPDWEWVRTLPGTGHTDAALGTEGDAEAAATAALAWAKEAKRPVSFLKAPLSLRRDGEVWWPLSPAFPLMQRMKETLDPNGTLNPGRFVGRL
jgi:FAD/FMN-containing dehydrogenase